MPLFVYKWRRTCELPRPVEYVDEQAELRDELHTSMRNTARLLSMLRDGVPFLEGDVVRKATSPSTASLISGIEGNQEIDENFESQYDTVNRTLDHAERVGAGYFFSLGINIKQERGGAWSVQDAWDKCIRYRVPAKDWPNFIRKYSLEHE